jgi:hypothetical protein
MLETLPGTVTLARLVQLRNAAGSMEMTPLEMFTTSTLVSSSKAYEPMMTGIPLMVPGMFTAPPGPAYSTMVATPLLAV